jgi:hypothetical protein
MHAVDALAGLMAAIDAHRWSELAGFLHADFRCHYVHTSETFDADRWIRINANYPGFDHLVVEQLLGDELVAACRSHVTTRHDSGTEHFACATFVTMQDGLIQDMTEVWTDISQEPPSGARPA